MPAMIEETTAEGKEKKGKKVVKRKTIDKWKKKKWFSLTAPSFFNSQSLGETVAEEPEMVMKRSIVVNAADLTNQSKLRHIALRFQVSNVQGQKAQTQLVGHEIQDSYLRRLVRRRSSKIQVVEDVSLKDGEKVRVKAVTITGRKASRAQESEIRRIMKEELKNSAANKPFDQFVQELIFGTASSNIFKAVKKIVPIKRIEINKSLVLKQKN
jgi:small subunit ribosomal protein S3Ae